VRSDEPQGDWPVPDAPTGVIPRTEETLVGTEPPPPPPPPRRFFDNSLALGMLALLLVAAAGAAAYFLLARSDDKSTATTVVVTTAPATTQPAAAKVMPQLVGLPKDQALEQLRKLGVSATVVERATDKPTGIVVKQDPVEATPLKPVTLVVDKGAPVQAATLPNFVGQPVAEARAAAERMKLVVTTTPVTTADKPAGTVVDQAPAPGTDVKAGDHVTLSVAKAPTQTAPTQTSATTTSAAPAPAQPQTVTVPDVTSQEEAAAVQALGQAGILPSLSFVASEEPLGTVVAQAKPAGTTVPYRSHMQINASSGPNGSPTQTVPRVIGMTLQQAVAALNAAHLRLIYLKLPGPRASAGKIVQQSPPQGGSAPENAQVLVFLGVFRG
jgi:beta-lactam-binding protein with PASTA domain